jgi:type III restriction enzyme
MYEPDFLVRLATGLTLVIEIKGQQHGDTDAKHQAARRWVTAVNQSGRLGRWDFLVCRDPRGLQFAVNGIVATQNRIRVPELER